MQLQHSSEHFSLSHKGQLVMQHSIDNPALFIGIGNATFKMYRGNFDISDYLIERLPLKAFDVEQQGSTYSLTFYADQQPCLILTICQTEQGRLQVSFQATQPQYNRLWLRIAATPEERVFGCGEQPSHFNLRGKHFPLWTSEPGVGRNKKTYVTWLADVKDRAGGDYYTTNYPQPTFVSSHKYFCHLQMTAYADFDFRHADFHELQCWEIPEYLLFDKEETFPALMTNITDFFGRQPELPEWVYNGMILGIQGGTKILLDKLTKAKAAGIPLAAAWCQDWQGIKYTSFGKRLQWEWRWNPELYPGLDTKINALKEQGIRFLGYINSYLLKDFPLYNEAKAQGYLATHEDGSVYDVDFGEFDCGIVDFTDHSAFEWYKDVIKQNLLQFGLAGWMADFGEYLPIDCVLKSGRSAELEHNDWPRLWAKVNHEAIQEAGKTDDILFFMRAGYTGIQRYCHVLWGGDQSVDWSMDDGLASVIPAALSSAMMGNGIHHSDIGGYTTLHGMRRTKELFMRWAEMAAFTPVMRSHEGNRPDENHQYDTDAETMAHLAAMTRIYTHLTPYIKAAVSENAKAGIPVQRPLFMHYDDDHQTYDIQYQYLFGRDMLIAPVYLPEQCRWKVYLPKDNWIHLWSRQSYDESGWIEVDAPLGQPPVFYRSGSPYIALFNSIPK